MENVRAATFRQPNNLDDTHPTKKTRLVPPSHLFDVQPAFQKRDQNGNAALLPFLCGGSPVGTPPVVEARTNVLSASSQMPTELEPL
jgi:hypothetical protein